MAKRVIMWFPVRYEQVFDADVEACEGSDYEPGKFTLDPPDEFTIPIQELTIALQTPAKVVKRAP